MKKIIALTIAVAVAGICAPAQAADLETGNLSATNAAADNYIAGKLGIGTTANALYRMTVDGTAWWNNIGSGGNGEIVYTTPAGNLGIAMFADHASRYRTDIRRTATGLSILSSTGSSAPSPTGGLIIENGGEVGIGTESPSEKLEVNGTARFTRIGIGTAGDVGFPLKVAGAGSWDPIGTQGKIVFSTPAGEVGIAMFADSATKQRTDVRRGENGLSLLMSSTSGSPAADNGLIILNDGSVGVGTTSPTETLHVDGTARFDEGITYIAPLGDLSMGSFTNMP